MISPELNVVRDRVHGPEPYGTGHGSPEPYMAQGAIWNNSSYSFLSNT